MSFVTHGHPQIQHRVRRGSGAARDLMSKTQRHHRRGRRGRTVVILVFQLKGRGVILCPYYLNERRENKFSVNQSNRMVVSVNVCTFRWYFTGANSFSSIFRKSSSLSATQLIFPPLSLIMRQFSPISQPCRAHFFFFATQV